METASTTPSTSIPTEANFGGFAAQWYYWDAKKSTLTTELSSGATLSSSTTPTLTIHPLYFNAPGVAKGSNATTQFAQRGKPTAYLKVQVVQQQAGSSSTTPLTWAAMYPVINNPNDDIGTQRFADQTSGNPIEHVPIPGGAASLYIPLAAVVGGAKPATHSLAGILQQVLGVSGSAAGNALFPIPQANVSLASNVESLLNLASNAFAPETHMQYWISPTDTTLILNTQQDAPPDALKLPLGTSFLVAVPTGDNDICLTALQDVLSNRAYAIKLDPNHELIVSDNGKVVDPNPFADLIYIVFRAIVANKTS